MVKRRRKATSEQTAAEKLESLVRLALAVAAKAKKHRQNLAGNTYYGNKLAELRADAANLFRDIESANAGEATAAAELIEAIFSASTIRSDRNAAAREFMYSLRTTFRKADTANESGSLGFFPQSILVQTNRSYLVTVGRQMNGSYSAGWFDAGAVMMRRLIEISIIEAFEAKGLASAIKDSNGNYLQLSDLVGHALSQSVFALSRNVKTSLPSLRDAGHRSAHGRYFHARREDLDKLQSPCRVVVEEFLHHAGLL